MEQDYLASVVKQFKYYKELGDKTIYQLTGEQLHFAPDSVSNSIAVIIKHLSGNMLSRWTDFLNSDGEKPWRNRDQEFETENTDKTAILARWEEGWNVFLTTLESLTGDDLKKLVYIRNQGHTVLEAINRQLAHYPYHIGQIVFLGKSIVGDSWQSLSIPKGNSNQFNAEKFALPKRREHFTDSK